MALIAINDVVTPDMYDEYMTEEWATRSALFRSGIVAESEKMDAMLDNGGKTFQFPFWKINDLAAQDATPVNEGDTLTPDKITAGEQIARRHFLEKAWGQNDTANVQAGDDPVGAILTHLGDWWDKQYQKALFSSVRGVIADNVANDSSDMILDITGNAISRINADDIIDTLQLFGDQGNSDVAGIGMHSKQYAELQKANLIDTQSDNEADIGWGTYFNKTVIVDDTLTDGTNYWAIMFKNGAFMSGYSSRGYIPSETDRNAAASGGQTLLYTRRTFAMHPHGFAWADSGSVTTTYPTYANMAEAAQWDRVVGSVKNTGFVVLKTTG